MTHPTDATLSEILELQQSVLRSDEILNRGESSGMEVSESARLGEISEPATISPRRGSLFTVLVPP